ncbi:MAG: electron transfer flavoprotein subunit alpha/FixB family protein [Janthinobacterium lividum]
MTALVIAEHDNATLHKATLAAVTAALGCDADVHVLVAGADCRAVAEQAAGVAGVARVLLADAPHLAAGLPENLAAQIVLLARDYTCIAAAATASGKGALPRVAALLDVAQISEITAVRSPDTFERPLYAGNAMATVRSLDPIRVVTVRVTAFDPAAFRTEAGSAAEIVAVNATPDTAKARFVSRELTQSDRPDLADAGIVVSGGRGLGSGENYRSVLEPLADKLGAALGASRAAVDAGYVPNDFQVGQTGKVVAPRLYVAVGISGAIQHLAGMKDSGVIIAVNKDAEAPIFQVADYGLVGDLFEAVPSLVQQL